MNIYAKPGDKVKPIYKDGKLQHGYDHERIEASKYLEEGKIYTVRKTSVSSWSSLVTLEEIPDKSFNTVHFEDPSEGELPVDGLLKEQEAGEKIKPAIMGSGIEFKPERTFTLAEVLEIWATAYQEGAWSVYDKNPGAKQKYFKEKFNIDLP